MNDNKTEDIMMPAIGIRPTIDGRRKGVRESLEERTMQMARNAAELISTRLKTSEGKPVECIIADTCIGGVAEAAACEDKFIKSGVSATLTVTPCWCYGSETMDMNPFTQKAVWGFNGTERPGAVYLAAVMAAHTQKGLPAFSIYGHDVQDADDESIPADVQEKILRWARTANAVGIMRGKSYLSIGGVSMGIAGSIVDPHFFQDYLGMRNEYVDMTEIIRRIDRGIFDRHEYEKALSWVKLHCKEGEDINQADDRVSSQKKESQWEYIVKMAIIVRDLMVGNPKLIESSFGEEAFGHNAIAAGFQGQRQWTDHLPNGDFLESILNSSFDWNGIRKPYIIATENDCLNGLAMLFGHLLTNTAQVFADVRTYWSPEAVNRVTGKQLSGTAQNGIIHLINSGAAAMDGCGEQTRNDINCIKPWWEVTPDEVDRCLEAVRWCPADTQYFRGGGFSSQFYTRYEMPVTMIRLNLVKGLGPVLQLAEGWTINLPNEIHNILDRRTNPTWPTTWFAPRLTGKGAFTDVYNVMANWGANHGAFCYGHIGADLVTLASMLRIPVNMHNLDSRSIFRPHSWSAFGTEDMESADYRACMNFGPLYGR